MDNDQVQMLRKSKEMMQEPHPPGLATSQLGFPGKFLGRGRLVTIIALVWNREKNPSKHKGPLLKPHVHILNSWPSCYKCLPKSHTHTLKLPRPGGRKEGTTDEDSENQEFQSSLPMDLLHTLKAS